MLRCHPRLSLFCGFLLVAGCSTAPRSGEPLRPPAPPAQKATTSPSEVKVPRKPGEFTVLVESDPSGATVVLDGVPLGRTPRQIVLVGNSRGFCRNDVSIKVRFIASDTAHASQTVEEVLTPLDKIPAVIRFTQQGATRVARDN
ncbi:MAG: PEGA domain-containing protein [Nibricoccus sp.]